MQLMPSKEITADGAVREIFSEVDLCKLLKMKEPQPNNKLEEQSRGYMSISHCIEKIIAYAQESYSDKSYNTRHGKK